MSTAWQDHIDSLSPEQVDLLAAYLDGALGADERAEVEALIARSEAAREVVAKAVALESREASGGTAGVAEPDPSRSADEREGGPTAPGMADLQSRRRSRMWTAAWLVPLAVAASLVLLLPTFRGGSTVEWTRGIRVDQPVAMPDFSTTRSGGVVPSGSGIRAGALWASYRAMVVSDQSAISDAPLAAIDAELETQAARGPAQARLDSLRQTPSTPAEAEVDAVDLELRALYTSAFAQGFALQSVAIAAAAGDRETVRLILDGPEAAAALDLAREARLEAEVAVLTAAAGSRDGAGPETDVVAGAVRTILRRIGS